MNASIQIISIPQLALAFIPALVVIGIMYRWAHDGNIAIYALVRMLLQLVLIGYVLTFIFETKHSAIIVLVLAVMLVIASWIALRPLKQKQNHQYLKALAAIAMGGITTLLLVTQGVLNLEPWYEPRYLVPLAGMIFANSMNSVSLAAERYESEKNNGVDYLQARRTAFNASMIPIVNSLFAVGLVSLPGMMTGQILSGVSPLIAVRYQIMVMCMIFGSAGISAALYLVLIKPKTVQD